ncbi:MAG: DUF6293 family protein [Methanomassiliicoccaceae archaeon]|nr:DUF6293 family protein [Methanomassiliicoccaceae archaeon]
MSSGRKERVVISCVTFETSKITDPASYYAATKVHLIHYADPSDERNRIYTEFYEQVCRMIRKDLPKTEIIEHVETVYDFTTMLRTVLNILREEKNADVFVNISAGTSEYTAAAVIASMMTPGTIPFSVSTKEYSIPDDELRRIYYSDGVPVGLTSVTRDPKALPHYRIDVPDEHLVTGLRIMEKKSKEGRTSGTIVIDALKEYRIWFRKERPEEDDLERRRYDAVCYQRDFIDKWKENGWIEKDRRTKKYFVTETGRIVLDTFYTENLIEKEGDI